MGHKDIPILSDMLNFMGSLVPRGSATAQVVYVRPQSQHPSSTSSVFGRVCKVCLLSFLVWLCLSQLQAFLDVCTDPTAGTVSPYKQGSGYFCSELNSLRLPSVHIPYPQNRNPYVSYCVAIPTRGLWQNSTNYPSKTGTRNSLALLL